MADKITTLEQVAGVLESQGYAVQQAANEAVMVDVNGTEHPFVAVLTEDKVNEQFVVTCQMAQMGDLDEDSSAQFMLAALDANTAIRPYAFAVITDTDDPAMEDPEQWPIVLTSSMPIGDFSEEELIAAMNSLWSAIAASVPVLKIGLSK